MTSITPVALADLKLRLAQDIEDGNKAASIGTLFQLSLNVGQFIEEQGQDLAKDSRETYCSQVFDYASRIANLSGNMDEADIFIWNEALEHMELSFSDRCPQLLTGVKALRSPRAEIQEQPRHLTMQPN